MSRYRGRVTVYRPPGASGAGGVLPLPDDDRGATWDTPTFEPDALTPADAVSDEDRQRLRRGPSAPRGRKVSPLPSPLPRQRAGGLKASAVDDSAADLHSPLKGTWALVFRSVNSRRMTRPDADRAAPPSSRRPCATTSRTSCRCSRSCVHVGREHVDKNFVPRESRYVAKTVVVAVLLVVLWRHYTRIRWNHWWLGVIVGVVGIFQWVPMQLWLQQPLRASSSRRTADDVFDPTETFASPRACGVHRRAHRRRGARRAGDGGTVLARLPLAADPRAQRLQAGAGRRVGRGRRSSSCRVAFAFVHGNWWLTSIVWGLMIGAAARLHEEPGRVHHRARGDEPAARRRTCCASRDWAFLVKRPGTTHEPLTTEAAVLPWAFLSLSARSRARSSVAPAQAAPGATAPIPAAPRCPARGSRRRGSPSPAASPRCPPRSGRSWRPAG